ncbi:MAG: cold-shock protein [Promethearchaeia archaeon]
MPHGTVKFFLKKKGYGFITSDDGQDFFVHFSAIKTEPNKFKTLFQGDIVEFDIVDGKKGPQADNVVVLEKASDLNRR